MTHPTPDHLPSWAGRRVAVTGATGFVGSHVAAALAGRGAGVVAVHRAGSDVARLLAGGVRCTVAPLTDEAALAAAFRGADTVIHAAGAVDFGDDWEHCRAVNVGGTRAVLAAARAAGVRRVVHVSSIVAVGAGDATQIQDETAAWDLGRYRVPYVTTKREAEDAALAANGRGLEVVVVNPASVVGPGDFTGSEFGTLCNRFWRGRVPVHFPGGNNFVDVRDVADGTLRAAARGRPGERYLLGSTNLSFARFFAALARAAGRPVPRVGLPRWLAVGIAEAGRWVRRKPGKRPYLTPGQARLLGLYFFVTSDKARRELGYTPRPLAHTLRDAHAFWTAGRAA